MRIRENMQAEQEYQQSKTCAMDARQGEAANKDPGRDAQRGWGPVARRARGGNAMQRAPMASTELVFVFGSGRATQEDTASWRETYVEFSRTGRRRRVRRGFTDLEGPREVER